jgi:hypothetical protein
LECMTGACGIRYIPADQIYTAWRDSQPLVSPANHTDVKQ